VRAPNASPVAKGANTRRPAASTRRRPRLGFLLSLGVLVLMGFLYYRPLASYFETRAQLSARTSEVVALRAEKTRLERRLARTTSLVVLARDARRIGYVKPGERLFIVKGLAAWRQEHAATVSGDERP
jgi:cell division protein FtsB